MGNKFTVLILTSLIMIAGCEPTETTAGFDSTTSQDYIQKATTIVDTALTDQSAVMRTNAIETVGASKQIKLMPKVQKLLRNDVVAVRFASALTVGELKYSPAMTSVSHLLADNNEKVRLAAAYAMTRMGKLQYDKVIYAATTSSDQAVRGIAAMLLGKLGDKKALPTLHKMLSAADSTDSVKFQAAEAIAILGDEKIYPKLWTMLISAYADDRMMGIRAMGALGTIKAENAIITMLDDTVPEVRLVAAEQLGQLGNPTGEPEVLDMLNKKSTARLKKQNVERIKILTSLAIGRIGTDRLIRFLPRFLDDNSPVVRLAAAKAVLIVMNDRK